MRKQTVISLLCAGVLTAGAVTGLMGFADNDTALAGSAGTEKVQLLATSDVDSDSDSDSSDTAGATGTITGVSDVAAAAMPSVVSITNKSVQEVQNLYSIYGYGAPTYEQESTSCGSGIIIGKNDSELLICTNNHVVENSTELSVGFADESVCEAVVKGTDASNDLAVVAVKLDDISSDTMDAIKVAEIGDSDKLVVGQQVVAIGNALGYGQSVTTGIVSALNRQVTVQDNDMTLIQTDASISPGNSGGGLFNANGELIGIVNAKSSYSEAEGIGFAIPINTAMEIGRQLIENGSVARPALGVKIVDVTDAQTAQQLGVSTMGVYVVEVTKGSGADAADVQAGDRVLAVDDTAVSDSSALKNYLKDKGIGDTVNLQVERDGKVLTLAVTLGSSAQ